MPGEEIVISKDINGDLTEVRYRVNAVSTLIITKNQNQIPRKNIREGCGNPQPFHQR